MPPTLVQSFADKSGESVERVEELWNKAKALVKKEYDIKGTIEVSALSSTGLKLMVGDY